MYDRYEKNNSQELDAKMPAPSNRCETVRREKPSKPPRPRTGATAGTKIRIKGKADPNEPFALSPAFWEKITRLTQEDLKQRAEADNATRRFFEEFGDCADTGKACGLSNPHDNGSSPDDGHYPDYSYHSDYEHPPAPFTPAEWTELRSIIKKQMDAQTLPSQSELLASACELVYLVLMDRDKE